MALPMPGLFAVCRSTTYEVASSAADTLNLFVTADEDHVPPHVAEGEDRRGRRWVKVSKADLERYFSVRVIVEWRGEQLDLGRVVDDTAEVHASSPAVAARLGLEGDQYNGFRGKVPVTELTVVEVREEEIDV